MNGSPSTGSTFNPIVGLAGLFFSVRLFKPASRRFIAGRVSDDRRHLFGLYGVRHPALGSPVPAYA
jgi:hypothetical protein